MDWEIVFVEHVEEGATDKPHCSDCRFGMVVTDKPHCSGCRFGRLGAPDADAAV